MTLILPTLDTFRDAMALHPGVWALAAGFVGACIASFAGVLVDRLPHVLSWRAEPEPGRSLMAPSRCGACGGRLGPLALFPVLGWVILRGRCGSCRSPVPAAYPIAEAACGLASAAVAARIGATADCAATLALLWGLLALAWIDWVEGWLPDCIAAPLTILGLCCSPFVDDPADRIHGLALCCGAVTAAMGWLSWRKGSVLFAGGDVMFAALAGAWLGFMQVPAFLLAVAAAYVAHHAAMWLSGRRWEPADPALRDEVGDLRILPMGPALAFAVAAVAAVRIW